MDERLEEFLSLKENEIISERTLANPECKFFET